MSKTNEAPLVAPVERLEKIPVAARRMGLSVSSAYRELKTGRLSPLVKLGPRASAVPASAVDAWIAARVRDALKEQGARHG